MLSTSIVRSAEEAAKVFDLTVSPFWLFSSCEAGLDGKTRPLCGGTFGTKFERNLFGDWDTTMGLPGVETILLDRAGESIEYS